VKTPTIPVWGVVRGGRDFPYPLTEKKNYFPLYPPKPSNLAYFLFFSLHGVFLLLLRPKKKKVEKSILITVI
jgi:hypothetical protein